MGIKVKDYLDVNKLDFSDMQLFKEYIEWENFKYDLEQLKKETVELLDLLKNNEDMNEKKQYQEGKVWKEYTDEKPHDMFYGSYNAAEDDKYNEFDNNTDKAA